ncbi:30S ribosomal protein S13 [Candidatus Woesearchaeota archaeon]|nr:30S ribosomal protein S13 [Candidatus Woesearchaeota archaeon]
MEETKSKNFRDIVRVVDKDVSGHTSILLALTKVRGSDFMFANAVCEVLDLNKRGKIGNISPEQMKKIEECMRNPGKYKIPAWLLNRRKDIDTGEDKHLISADLKLRKDFDIRFLKKLRCYRGIRHFQGKRVRGQRTRTSGRTGTTLGVKRKKKSGKK